MVSENLSRITHMDIVRFREAQAAGDQDGMKAFFDRIEPIIRMVAKRCAETGDVPDMAQRVRLQFLRTLDSYDPKDSSIFSWIYSIAHHIRVDLYRRSIRRDRGRIDSEVDSEQLLDHRRNNPLDLASLHERSELFEKAVEMTSEQCTRNQYAAYLLTEILGVPSKVARELLHLEEGAFATAKFEFKKHLRINAQLVGLDADRGPLR